MCAVFQQKSGQSMGYSYNIVVCSNKTHDDIGESHKHTAEWKKKPDIEEHMV